MIDHGRLFEIYSRYYLEGNPVVDELYDIVIELISERDDAANEAADMRDDLAHIETLKEEIDNLTADLRDAENRAHRLECDLEAAEAGR